MILQRNDQIITIFKTLSLDLKQHFYKNNKQVNFFENNLDKYIYLWFVL